MCRLNLWLTFDAMSVAIWVIWSLLFATPALSFLHITLLLSRPASSFINLRCSLDSSSLTSSNGRLCLFSSSVTRTFALSYKRVKFSGDSVIGPFISATSLSQIAFARSAFSSALNVWARILSSALAIRRVASVCFCSKLVMRRWEAWFSASTSHISLLNSATSFL